MIEKIKTFTWEVRSHGQETTISSEGIIENWTFQADRTVEMLSKAKIKKMIWHLQDVLKCMRQIEKEKEKKKAYEKSIKDLGELLDERKGKS